MATAKPLRARLAAFAVNPLVYVIGLGCAGACAVVAGIAVLAGVGFALVAAGAFLLAAAAFITRGMSNG